MARPARSVRSPTTIYNRYVRWGERGIWQRILDALATECEDALIFIDNSSIVKAQRAAAGSKGGELAQGTGRSCGGRGRKVHAAADHRGRALRIEITGAQTHDSKAFGAFIG